jgi:ribonuclease VapC
MIVDSSALLCILAKETDWMKYFAAVEDAAQKAVSAANFFEAAIVFDKRTRHLGGQNELDQLITKMSIEIVAVTFTQVHVARAAYVKYGRGNHPAQLNFGDCFAYALSRETGRPLLFKGGDFSQTDISAAL